MIEEKNISTQRRKDAKERKKEGTKKRRKEKGGERDIQDGLTALRRPRTGGFLAGRFYAATAGAFSASFIGGQRNIVEASYNMSSNRSSPYRPPVKF